MQADGVNIERMQRGPSRKLSEKDWLFERVKLAALAPNLALSDFVSNIGIANVAASLIWDEIKNLAPKYLIGAGLQCMPLLHAVAFAALKDEYPLRVLMIREERKGHNRKKWIEGEPPREPTDAVLISDFFADEQSFLFVNRAILAEDYPLRVVGAASIFNIRSREDSGSQPLNFLVHSIFSQEEIALKRDAESVRYLLAERSMPMPKRDAIHMNRIRLQLKAKYSRTERVREIESFDKVDVDKFQCLARKGVPFLITGIVSSWPIARMTVADLVEKYGNVRANIRVKNYIDRPFSKERIKIDMTIGEFISLTESSDEGLPPYLGNQHLEALVQLCEWPPYFASAREPKVWLGPAGTVTPLHRDLDDNLFAQVWGEKKFILYSPADAECFDTWRVNHALDAMKFDPETPSNLWSQKERNANPIHVNVRAGQILFIPAGWLHHVRAIDLSLSVNSWSDEKPVFLKDI